MSQDPSSGTRIEGGEIFFWMVGSGWWFHDVSWGFATMKVYFQSSNEVLLEGAVGIYGDNHAIYLHKAYKYGKRYNIL